LEEEVGVGNGAITLWNSSIIYAKNDIVLFFKTENKQTSAEQYNQTFAFLLVSMKDDNTSIPNYDVIDGVPDFTKTNWFLLNPMSYLLQNLDGLKDVVREVFQQLVQNHVHLEHSLVGSSDIDQNLLKKDFSNLQTPWSVGKYSLIAIEDESDDGKIVKKVSSNGIMEYSIQYSFDNKANNEEKATIVNKMHYLQKSPIWDKSDHTIFTKKYMEDDMLSVSLNRRVGTDKAGQSIVKYTQFNNLRYGTNVFVCDIEFPTKFKNDEYMVFFDSYEPGSFVFGYDKFDLQDQPEPTWDAIVSQPMLMNKTNSGFTVVLPIHTHFNSIKKYNIGVPWKNEFRLQVIGRYR
jgi:hypothetical protein